MTKNRKMTLNENINVIVEQSEQKKQSFFKKFPCIKTNLDKGIGQITSLDDGSPVYFLNGNFYKYKSLNTNPGKYNFCGGWE